MFATGNPRHDFADTRDFSQDPAYAHAGFVPLDALEQLDHASAADTHLLQLVVCTACATLTLALISSLA